MDEMYAISLGVAFAMFGIVGSLCAGTLSEYLFPGNWLVAIPFITIPLVIPAIAVIYYFKKKEKKQEG